MHSLWRHTDLKTISLGVRPNYTSVLLRECRPHSTPASLTEIGLKILHNIFTSSANLSLFLLVRFHSWQLVYVVQLLLKTMWGLFLTPDVFVLWVPQPELLGGTRPRSPPGRWQNCSQRRRDDHVRLELRLQVRLDKASMIQHRNLDW